MTLDMNMKWNDDETEDENEHKDESDMKMQWNKNEIEDKHENEMNWSGNEVEMTLKAHMNCEIEHESEHEG